MQFNPNRSNEVEQPAGQAVQSQPPQTARQAHLLLARSRQLLERFRHFYTELRDLPRPVRRRWQRKLGASLAGVALTLALSHTPVAHAATITVGGSCTLIDAINAANSDTAVGGCTAGSGADMISLGGATYTLTSADNTGAFGNDNGLPVITSAIIIDGAGATITRDENAPPFRLFEVASTGNLTLDHVTISGGQAGDGAYTPGHGGGIFNNNGGVVTLTNSTVSGNAASADFDTNGGKGGGIFNAGTLAVTNSTISGNFLFGVGFLAGAGIYNGGQATLTASTVSDNYDPNGSIHNTGGGTLTLSNSIIASQGQGGACGGAITSNGYNLDSDGSCGLSGTGDISNGNANLGPLQVNAPGDTATHALLTGSDAIDAGDCNGGAITTDQRGVSRPQGAVCDIGAYELEQTPPTATPTNTPEPPTATPTNTPVPPTATPTNTAVPPTATPTNTPVPNATPDCTTAYAEPALLWPPNHAMQAISVLGITDPDGQPVSVSVTSVFQDEPTNGTGDGDTAPDATLSPLSVRAERSGNGDGRVYHVGVTASDGVGGSCSVEIQVGVPHSKKKLPVDGGSLYNSTN
jgi:hypothetical protein